MLNSGNVALCDDLGYVIVVEPENEQGYVKVRKPWSASESMAHASDLTYIREEWHTANA